MRSWINKFNPDCIIICWDGNNGSVRKREIYKDYKAHRKPFFNMKLATDKYETDDNSNRLWQLQKLVEILAFLPVCQLYVDNCEADDIIFYVCEKFANIQKIIITSDKDMYQLINKNTNVYSLSNKTLINEDTLIENYSVSPQNFALYKSILGDKSDNIDGVRGVGPKTFTRNITIAKEKRALTLNEVKLFLNTKNSKLYNTLIDNDKILNRNLDLIKLNYDHISLNQITKLDSTIKSYKPIINVFGFRKYFITSRIIPTYIESILRACKQLNRNLDNE